MISPIIELILWFLPCCLKAHITTNNYTWDYFLTLEFVSSMRGLVWLTRYTDLTHSLLRILKIMFSPSLIFITTNMTCYLLFALIKWSQEHMLISMPSAHRLIRQRLAGRGASHTQGAKGRNYASRDLFYPNTFQAMGQL